MGCAFVCAVCAPLVFDLLGSDQPSALRGLVPSVLPRSKPSSVLSADVHPLTPPIRSVLHRPSPVKFARLPDNPQRHVVSSCSLLPALETLPLLSSPVSPGTSRFNLSFNLQVLPAANAAATGVLSPQLSLLQLYRVCVCVCVL